MKKILFGITLLISVACFAQSKKEEALRKVLDGQTKAWNNGNIEDFMKGYWQNDSLMFVGKSGITYGWQNTLNNYKRNYPDTNAMGKLSFDILSVKRLSQRYFHVIGKWNLYRNIGNLEGHFMLLFKKIKARWLIIADHSS